MKKIIAVIAAAALLLSLAACKNKPEGSATPEEPVEKDYVEFLPEEDSGETLPTVSQAQAIIEAEDADPASKEYRAAVYVVNETVVSDHIDYAHENNKQTKELKEVFTGVYFRFLEGEQFGSETVRKKLIKLGTWERPDDDEWYFFTFHDRTLAQAAVNLNDDHCLKAYTEVLELLLSDPNITVKTLL